jgi:hypothetical protein
MTTNIDNYDRPIWIVLCQVLGFICLLIFGGLALYSMTRGSYGGRGGYTGSNTIMFASLAVGSFIHFFFISWCVKTFSDIRHYARETAIALRGDKQDQAK